MQHSIYDSYGLEFDSQLHTCAGSPPQQNQFLAYSFWLWCCAARSYIIFMGHIMAAIAFVMYSIIILSVYKESTFNIWT